MKNYASATARTWLEVNDDALIANYLEAKSLCQPGTTMIAVLKADAYGYGACHVGHLLWDAGARHFSVACADEALELRAALPEAWILNMGTTAAVQLDSLIQAQIRITVQSEYELLAVSQAAKRIGQTAYIHIKLDTGLHRLGFTDTSFTRLLPAQNICMEGVYSHLALRDDQQSKDQQRLFSNMITQIREKGIEIPMVHLLDSIGLVRYPAWQENAVRVGAFLYGNVPTSYEHFERKQAVGKFCTRVTRVSKVPKGEGIGYDESPLLHDTVVATLAAGYVDGYPRVLSGTGEVEIHGKRAKVLGLICMDQMMVDVTNIPDVHAGDIAVLLGDGVSLVEFAAWGHLNRNEVTAMIGRRVPRIYMRHGLPVEILSRI